MAALNYSMPCMEGNQVSLPPPPHFSLLPRQGQRKSTGQLPPLFPHIHVVSFRLKPAHPFLTRNPLNFLSSSGSAHSVLVSALIFPANVATALAGSCSRLVEKISVFTAQLQFAVFFNRSHACLIFLLHVIAFYRGYFMKSLYHCIELSMHGILMRKPVFWPLV
jgi:hypothetical protein